MPAEVGVPGVARLVRPVAPRLSVATAHSVPAQAGMGRTEEVVVAAAAHMTATAAMAAAALW